MAEKLDEPVFWLPAELLTNENDYKTECFNTKTDHDFSFGSFNNLGLRNEDEFFAADSIFCSNQTPNVWKSNNLSGFVIPNSAAEELERMRKVHETMSFYSAKIFAPTQKPNQVTGSLKNQNIRTGFYSNRSDILFLQLHARQVQLLNQQRMMNRVMAQKRMDCYQLKGRTGPGLFGETGVKKERTGTGVFIPKGFGIGTNNVISESCKKPECNKVVSDHDIKPTYIYTTEYDAALKRRNLSILAQQRKSLMRPKQAMMNQEVSLPQDWTY